MELTKEVLLERRHSLEADALAINGALQQVDWSLAKLDEEAAPTGAVSDSPTTTEEAP